MAVQWWEQLYSSMYIVIQDEKKTNLLRLWGDPCGVTVRKQTFSIWWCVPNHAVYEHDTVTCVTFSFEYVG